MKNVWRRWLRRLGWATLSMAGVAVFLFSIALALTFTERYQRVPAEVWDTRDFRAIQAAATRQIVNVHDSALAQLLATDISYFEMPPTPPPLVNAAETWVATVNKHNPEAILYHDTDPLGNLYVMLGAWWNYLDGDAQAKALDGLGVAWRYHLRTSFGEWDASQGFEPGIVIVDDQGEVARNLNGEIKILRPTNTNP